MIANLCVDFLSSSTQDKVSVSMNYFEASTWEQEDEPFCKKSNNANIDQKQQQKTINE